MYLLTYSTRKFVLANGHYVVTGGAGYIGSHATLKLLEDGHSVTIIDNLSRGNLGALKVLEKLDTENRLQWFNVDLGNRAELFKLFSSLPPIDAVFHFAAVAFVGESMRHPLLYYSNVTTNTVNLLEAMKMANPPIKKLIYSSTCAVYGNPVELPVTEDTPVMPINPYGKSKFMAETAVGDYATSDKDFIAVILRYFNVVGADPLGRLGELPRPELQRDSRISTACFDAAFGDRENLVIMGTKFPTPDGTAIRDYVHVSDLVDAHIQVLPHLSNPPNLFNVGTGQGISVREFVNACKTVTQANISTLETEEPRLGDYAQVYANVDKIQNVVGWKARYTSIQDMLRDAWNWRQNHRVVY